MRGDRLRAAGELAARGITSKYRGKYPGRYAGGLIYISRPATEYRPARIDYRGLVLIASGVALSVFGFLQSGIWGWSNPGTGLRIAAGAVLLVVFYLVEARTPVPLIQVRIFHIRAFLVENLVLFVATQVFVPVFFFASEYAQIALGKTASQAGLFLLYFFIGFVIAAQIGGRMLDRRGAKLPVTLGCALAAVGFYLWAGKVTGLSFGTQQWYIILAGAARDPAGYEQLRRMLHVWSLAVVATGQPGYYEELAAARDGMAPTVPVIEAIPDWAGRVASVRDPRQ